MRRLNVIQRSPKKGSDVWQREGLAVGQVCGGKAPFPKGGQLTGSRCLLPAWHFTPAVWPESSGAQKLLKSGTDSLAWSMMSLGTHPYLLSPPDTYFELRG